MDQGKHWKVGAIKKKEVFSSTRKVEQKRDEFERVFE